MDEIKLLNTSDLIQKLKNYISDETTMQILQDEGINGKSFVDLTQQDMIYMNIKMGPAKELLQVIEIFKASVEKIVEGSFVVEEDGTLLRYEEDLNKQTDTVQMISNVSSDLSNSNTSVPNTEKTLVNRKKDLPTSSKPNNNSNATTINARKSRNSEQSSVNSSKFSRFSSIEETLMNHKQGKKLFNELKNNFNENVRRAFIRVMVQELTTVQGTFYPSNESKVALASAIVNEFPALKNTKSPLGYEHYYDSKTKSGYIHYRLQTLQKTLEPGDKKYQKRKRSLDEECDDSASTNSSLLSNEELSQIRELMNHKFPDEQNRESIISNLKKSFPNRRNWIMEKHPTISEIFATYQRMQDFNGDMMDVEFELIFPGLGDKFLSTFSTFYMPRIKNYVKKNKSNLLEKYIDIDDEALKCLLFLADLLPVSNAHKKKGKSNPEKIILSARRALLETAFENQPLQNCMTKRRQELGVNVQPYLIEVNGNYYAICDNAVFYRRQKSDIIATFDLLFKSYYVLNVEYPLALKNFYEFIETYIYQMKKPGLGTATVISLNIAFNQINCELESENDDC